MSLAYSRVWLSGLFVVVALMSLVVTSQVFKRLKVAVAVSIVVPLVLAVGFDQWAPKPPTPDHPPQVPIPLPAIPHVRATLVIESLSKKNGVIFHLNPETDIAIENIHARFVSSGLTDDEPEGPFHRTLEPGGQLSISGPGGLIIPHRYNRLNVTLFFKLKNDADQLATTFEFFFMADNPKTVNPEGGGITARVKEPTQQMGTDLMAAWRQPTAKMHLVLNEQTSDGKPNITNVSNSRRTLKFDPTYKTVTFSTRLASGKLITFSSNLSENRTGSHTLLILWDEAKGTASLTVDGRQARSVK